MSGFEWAAPLATSLAAVVASATALALGGVLSFEGRLLRRLEKRVAIFDKMPENPVRTTLGQSIVRSVIELQVRSQIPSGSDRWALPLGLAATLTFAVAAVLSLTLNGDGQLSSVLAPAWLYAGCAAVVAAASARSWVRLRARIRSEVEAKLAEVETMQTASPVSPPSTSADDHAVAGQQPASSNGVGTTS